jgi:type IV pilus assembly protein PilP
MLKIIVILLSISVGAWSAPANQNGRNFFKDKTTIDNPFNLRDPFKAPQLKSDIKKTGRGFKITGKGEYSNINETSLERLNLQALKVVGVLIGKERRAMVTTDGTKITILKEGMKLGPEMVELKAILPGGIVLVEKMVNVYGEEEFLETVIPISK